MWEVNHTFWFKKRLDCFQIIAHYLQNSLKLYGIYNLAKIYRLFLAGKTRCDIHRYFSPKCKGCVGYSNSIRNEKRKIHVDGFVQLLILELILFRYFIKYALFKDIQKLPNHFAIANLQYVLHSIFEDRSWKNQSTFVR